jgi:hypothetical protein
MTQSNWVSVVAAWDNRCPIPSDVANQLINELTAFGTGFDCTGCTITTLVKATMVAPLAGLNSIVLNLISPEGTTNDEIIAWVTDTILALHMPTTPYLSVVSVEVQ